MHPIFFSGQENALLELFKLKNYSSIGLLCDAKTNGFCSPVFRQIFSGLVFDFQINVPDGEHNKNLSTADLIWQNLFHYQIDKSACLVILGGGMLSDVGAFAASLYKRGIDFIIVPTTYLAMVDASLGGKNGLNYLGYKNQIGSIVFPQAVYINPCFLTTLPDPQLLSGYAESIKHAFLQNNSTLLEQLLRVKTPQDCCDAEMIKASVQIKSAIVDADPFEQKQRQWLNFGHTFGHALESASHLSPRPLLHGQAVLLGLLAELFLSEQQHQLSSAYRLQLEEFVQRFDQFKGLHFDSDLLFKAIVNDKKNRAGQVLLSLKTPDGMKENCYINTEQVHQALHYLKSFLNGRSYTG